MVRTSLSFADSMGWDGQPQLLTWRGKCSGMDTSLIAEMKVMAKQNRRLRKRLDEMSMQNDPPKEALGKSVKVVFTKGDGHECDL